MTIPQNAIPITVSGHPYILEFDEYAFRFNATTPPDTVGAARIIDIADEQHPRVVSNLRLAGRPARPAPRGLRRSRHAQPRPELRRPLLQRAPRGRPRDRRVFVHHLGVARVRHPRPASSQGDRLLRGAAQGCRRERLQRQQLRDVEAGVRTRAARDLVHGRRQRLLRAAGAGESVARPDQPPRRRLDDAVVPGPERPAGPRPPRRDRARPAARATPARSCRTSPPAITPTGISSACPAAGSAPATHRPGCCARCTAGSATACAAG